MSICNTIFWSSLIILFYTWIGYPFIIYLLTKIKRKPKVPTTPDELPLVSIIIAAYNEEEVIARRIENLLKQDYPKEKMEIIVASDGSTDRTVEIAKKYEGQGVRVLDFKKNRGRAAVHNDAVDVAKGEILLFTDAETIFEKNFVKNGVKWLANNRYGCGAGEFEFYYKDDIGRSENIYWKIEKKMRYWEFWLDILPFASGGCFFIRKELYEKIPYYSDIDNLLTLSTIAKGYKIFYAKDAKAYDFAVQGEKSYFKKRVRTTLRSFGDMLNYIPVLLKKKKWVTLWVLFSHRILRWLTGFFMGILLILNSIILISGELLYWGFFLAQIIFYSFAIAGKYQKLKIGRIFYSFLLANLASSIAIINLLTGKRISAWKN